MKNYGWAGFIALAILGAGFTSLQARSILPVKLYVATDGHDTQSGTIDAPLATLTGARNRLRSQGLLGRSLVVYLREGTYRLSQTFKLEKQDSGSLLYPIVYRSYPGETAVITGAKSLDPNAFSLVTDPDVLAQLPASSRDYVQVCDLPAQGITEYGELTQFTKNQVAEAELFIDSRPQALAQWPNEDFTPIGTVIDAGSTNPPRGAIFEYTDPRPETWADLDDVWAVGFWHVEMLDSVKIKRLDTARHRIETETAPTTWSSTGITPGHRMYFINVLDELDLPTEYYLDRDTGQLYIYPARPLTSASTIELSQLADDLIGLNKVSYVEFHDLVFEGSRKKAIGSSHSSHIEIAGCTFRNLGRHAIVMWLGEQNRIANNDFYELGAGAIRIFGGDRQTLDRGEYYIHNNHLYNYGRRDRTTCWPIRTERVGHTVSHNLLHGSWRGGCSFPGNDHLFEYNEICHILKHSNDSSAIGSGFNWTGSGTDIRYNFIHHYHGEPSHSIIAVGVYVDDGLSGNHVYQNVFYDLDMAFFSHGGRATHVNNNLIIDCDRSINYMDPSQVNWWGSRFATLIRKLYEVPSHTPLYTDRYPHLINLFADLEKNNVNPSNIEYQYPKDNEALRNLIYNSGALEIPYNALRYGTFDNNLSMAAGEDAGFIDPDTFNFGLHPDSPVYERILGFQEIPFDQIGLTLNDQRPEYPQLGSFDLLLPRDNTTLRTSEPLEFVWESCPFADRYELELATDSNFENVVKRVTKEDMCRSYEVATVDVFSFTRLYWRVRAITNARSMILDSTLSTTPHFVLERGRVSRR